MELCVLNVVNNNEDAENAWEELCKEVRLRIESIRNGESDSRNVDDGTNQNPNQITEASMAQIARAQQQLLADVKVCIKQTLDEQNRQNLAGTIRNARARYDQKGARRWTIS